MAAPPGLLRAARGCSGLRGLLRSVLGRWGLRNVWGLWLLGAPAAPLWGLWALWGLRGVGGLWGYAAAWLRGCVAARPPCPPFPGVMVLLGALPPPSPRGVVWYGHHTKPRGCSGLLRAARGCSGRRGLPRGVLGLWGLRSVWGLWLLGAPAAPDFLRFSAIFFDSFLFFAIFCDFL